jgi:hypothetical protein
MWPATDPLEGIPTARALQLEARGVKVEVSSEWGGQAPLSSRPLGGSLPARCQNEAIGCALPLPYKRQFEIAEFGHAATQDTPYANGCGNATGSIWMRRGYRH